MSPRTFFSSLTVALALGAAACGGPDKPPITPDKDVPPPLDTPSTPTAKPGSTDGPAAPSTSDDVTKGTAAVKAGDWNGARASFESAIKKNPKQADAHYYLGLVMDKTGDKAAAEKSYRTALELQPDLQEASENLTAILVEGKKYDDAIAIAKKALAKNAKNSEMALNLAIAMSEKGDVDGATKAFEDAVKLAPNDVRFFVAYGHHLIAAKKQAEGVAQLKKAQSVAGEDAGAVAAVGFEMRLARAVPECIAAFDKAISIKDTGDFRTNRGLCKLANKDQPGAIADFKAATEKEPSFALAHYWYGLQLHDTGKFPEAAAEYEQYLKLAPNGPMSKMAEVKLKAAKEKKKPEKPAPPKK